MNWFQKLFTHEPPLYEFMIWYSVKVEGTMSIHGHTGSVGVIAYNEDDARQYFTKMNPNAQINMITVSK